MCSGLKLLVLAHLVSSPHSSPQAALHRAGSAANVSPEGVQGEQTSVHGERGTALEAAQRGPGQSTESVSNLGPHVIPVPQQLCNPLQQPEFAQIAADPPWDKWWTALSSNQKAILAVQDHNPSLFHRGTVYIHVSWNSQVPYNLKSWKT